MKRNYRKWWVLGLSLLFIVLTVLVYLDKVTNFDTMCYNFVAYKVSEDNILTSIYKIFTFLGSTTFIIFLAVFFFVLFLILKKKNYSFIVASSIIISTIVNNVIKIIIRRARPTVLALVTETSYSFPSGHTMASVTMYGILCYLVLRSNLDKKLKITLSIILGIIPFLVGFSRIYLGAHFATDIIGGFLLSTILLLIITSYIDKKKLI